MFNIHTRETRAVLFGLFLVLQPLFGVTVFADTKPNVVIVITDDQGYGDLSCHGNPVLKTPKLDQLFRESVRLKDYHVAPTCSPTRAAFQTGHWTNRTGVWHTVMGRSMLRENEVTIGDVFKAAGYETGMFGKWHLGDNYPFRPEDRGYTEVFRHGGGGVGQAPDYWDNAYFGGHYWHNSTPEKVKGYCTDEFFNYAKKFVADCKSKKKPFLAYISTNAPHGPFNSPESFSAPYKNQSEKVANFFGMIANIDENVGKFREFLKSEDLAENTIFIFTTDNGTSAGKNIHNAGMRAGKGSEFDGGHRVPFFVHWPGGNLTGGKDVTSITAHVDVLPTLIDLCGIATPKDVKFDGQTIAPLLSGKAENWPDRILVTDSQRIKNPKKWKKSAVMTSRWRLINKDQLYDIKTDPGQEKDIAKDYPEVVQRLQAFYENWWTEIEPTFAQATNIYLGHPNENPSRLTSHDWITQKNPPWNQGQVRSAMNAKESTGYWNVKIYEDGEYEFRLRRWPPESDTAIDAPLPAGEQVPGTPTFRATKGVAISPVKATLKIADIKESKPVNSGDKFIAFKVKLKAGVTRLDTRFKSADGTEHGAYYVDVEKLKK